MASHHTNGAALRAWLEVATKDFPVELASRTQEEIRQHFDSAQEDAVAGGADPAQAYRQALESLGDPTEVNRMYRHSSLGDLFEGVPRRDNDPARSDGEEIRRETLKMNRPRLVWTSPEDGAQSLPLSASEVTIGRRADSDVQIVHQSSSRIHAKLVEVPGGYELVDLASHHGTFVNGKRIGRHRLHVGDTIQIGHDAAKLNYV